MEHETDEVLGTSSCISTQGPSLTDACGGSDPSAVDLFRYNGSGNRVLIDTTPGAYFSYNGGVSNGVPDGAFYNTISDATIMLILSPTLAVAAAHITFRMVLVALEPTPSLTPTVVGKSIFWMQSDSTRTSAPLPNPAPSACSA